MAQSFGSGKDVFLTVYPAFMATEAVGRGKTAWRPDIGKLGSARYLISHRRLLFRITLNDIRSRFAGSFLGAGWVFLAPLLILTVYGVVYVAIYRIKAPGMSATVYVLYVFAGLVPFLMTSEALTTGTNAVVTNKAVLNNTVFPIDLTPVKAVLASLGTMIVGAVVIVIGVCATGNLHWPIVIFPAIVVLHVLWLIGIAWVLSLLNVIFRDVQNLLTALLMILLVLSPIAYVPTQVPSSLKPLLALNPFAYFIVAYQRLMILGAVPSTKHFVGLTVMSLVTFAVGSWFFARAKQVIIDYV